jgi:SAM-dependent methyltransferase
VVNTTEVLKEKKAVNSWNKLGPLHTHPDNKGLMRQASLLFSESILQFPPVFELQQQLLRQPELLTNVVKEELEHLPKDQQDFLVLDYGCGCGTYAGLFDAKNYLGVDIDQRMIERASKLYPNHKFLQAGNLSDLRAQIGNISNLLLVGVVHHLSTEELFAIIADLPGDNPVRLLTIDTLKVPSGPGRMIQLFERGLYLREEAKHFELLSTLAEPISFSKVPYGKYFELAVFRGMVRR